MNKNFKKTVCLIIAVLLCLGVCGCGKNQKVQDIWKDATYTEDALLGEGSKAITVDVVTPDKTVTFTVKTEAETLGEALLENKLIEGEQGAYGMYIKKVIGMEADYNKTKTYWAVTKDGEYMSVGVDGEKISGGEKYELTLTEV